jgi:hypothetical protein
VNQSLRYYVDRNHKGWVRALPCVHFHIMNTVNASTGYSPFQLHLGCSLRMLPALLPPTEVPWHEPEDVRAHGLLSRLQQDFMEVQDNLLSAKATQATTVNKSRAPSFTLHVGDCVMLATKHHRRDYIQKGDKRVAKIHASLQWTIRSGGHTSRNFNLYPRPS